DSINYAKRIQEAILPSKEIKYKIFPEAFVFFQPKDIVSGDFYWFAEKNGKRIIATVDCTGHGVPGAFMSMIGNAFLNEIINEIGITTPSVILDELRKKIIFSLKQTGADGENKDGMDISLLTFDRDNRCVEFAGANNPLWKISNMTLEETKGNKQPIGMYSGDIIPFTNHTIELKKGDSLYIFTDGFADQFGGENGKKLKYKKIQEMLLSNNNISMKEQEKYMNEFMNKWKGDLEQVDDILFIGIKV
ncbi:MAG: SpoIIE family protein phosphatase, partial [Bacteroidetes bacterium]|nr:SpoIIE family protein phosphatase [Bacteroidota bacterium]